MALYDLFILLCTCGPRIVGLCVFIWCVARGSVLRYVYWVCTWRQHPPSCVARKCGCVACICALCASVSGKGGILDVAVLASRDTTAFNNLTAAAGTTEEDSVGSFGSLNSKLIKCIDLATSLEDSGARSLSDVQGAHFEGWEVQDAKVIGDSSHHHSNLVCSFVEAFDKGLEGDGDFVGSAVVEAL